MPCGCSDSCNCVLQGGLNTTVSGAGTSANPYVISSSGDSFFSLTNPGGGLDITPGGTNGHSPLIDIEIDPLSTAPFSVSGAGVRVDETVLSLTNPGGGLAIVPVSDYGHTTTVDIEIDPASTAPVSVSVLGLRVDCCVFGEQQIQLLSADASISAAATLVLVDTLAAAGNVTLTLPPPASATGVTFTVKDVGGNGTINNVLVDHTGVLFETSVGPIDNIIIFDYASARFFSDGTDWWVLV